MWRSAELVDLALGVERLLLPGECLVCHAALAEREWDAPVCALCRSRWKPLPHPLCQRCGQPDELRSCRFCAAWPHELERVRSAVWLAGPARVAVHRLKYDGWRRTAEPMANAMRSLAPRADAVLVPIPLGRRRLRSRGYNQAEVLARALGDVTGLPVRTDLLQRQRETTTQTALTPEARLANVMGAFGAWKADGRESGRTGESDGKESGGTGGTGESGLPGAKATGSPLCGDACARPARPARPAPPARPARPGEERSGARLTFVLVDDVCTTGATLVAAASALAAAGAYRVEAVTFARATLPVVGAV